MLRKFFLPVLCPSSVFSIVQQALLVVVPLYILEIGGSLAVAAAVVGIKGLGMMAADIPAGMLLSRVGDKRMMMGAAGLFLLSVLLMAVFPVLPVLIFASAIQGVAHGAWLVGRISYVSEATEIYERGRVMALMAGTIRIGSMIGPLAAGFLIAAFGYEVTLYMCALFSILVVVMLFFWMEQHVPVSQASHRLSNLVSAVKDNRHSFMTAGVGAVTLMLVRSSRTLLLPLVGASLLLDEASIGMVISAGAIIDTLLFYPAGSLMDRIGRKPIFIVSLVCLGIGIFTLPWVSEFWGLTLVSVLLGIGNGISAGVIMTVGADLAPKINRGSFIGVWRLLADVGVTSGPFIIGAVVKGLSLAMASHFIGLLGVAGALYVAKTVTETHQK